MNTRQRGELGIRLAGIAFCALFVAWNLQGAGIWTLRYVLYRWCIPIGAGLALLFLAPVLARHLFHEPGEPGRQLDHEALYVGGKLTGLFSLLFPLHHMLSMLILYGPVRVWSPKPLAMIAGRVVWGVLAVYLAWMPRHLQRFLGRLAGREAGGERADTRGYLAPGLILLGLYIAIKTPSDVISVLPLSPSARIGFSRNVLLTRLLLQMVLGVAVFCAAGPISRLFRPLPSQQGDGDDSPGAAGYLLVGLTLALAWGLCPLARGCSWLASGLSDLVAGVLVFPGVLVLGVLVGPPLVRRAAQWFYPDATPEGGRFTRAMWQPLNAGLTALFAYFLVASASETLMLSPVRIPQMTRYTGVNVIVVLHLLLLFRTDAAWLLAGRPRGEGLELGAAFRRQLRDANVLLGAWLLLWCLPFLITGVGTLMWGEASYSWMDLPWVTIIAATGLIALSDVLARRLSHGRITLRIWGLLAEADGGEDNGGQNRDPESQNTGGNRHDDAEAR